MHAVQVRAFSSRLFTLMVTFSLLTPCHWGASVAGKARCSLSAALVVLLWPVTCNNRSVCTPWVAGVLQLPVRVSSTDGNVGVDGNLQQVYDEGVSPLWSSALELVQRLRDLRAQEATMYGMYGVAEALYGSSESDDALAVLYGTYGKGHEGRGGGTAGAVGGSGMDVGRGGYGSLAHLDTLARGAPAAAAFLTALVESLRTPVEEQVGIWFGGWWVS